MRLQNYFLSLFILFVARTSFAENICLRSEAVREAIEQKLNKPCQYISADDLASITDTPKLS